MVLNRLPILAINLLWLIPMLTYFINLHLQQPINQIFRKIPYFGSDIYSRKERPYPPLHSDLNLRCPRFAYITGAEGAGLGNKIADMVFGYVFALEMNSTFVLNPKLFATDGLHGSYPWAEEFLGLSHIPRVDVVEKLFANMSSLTFQRWESANENKTSCSMLSVSCEYCCTDLRNPALNTSVSCHLMKYNAFNIAKSYFREIYKKGRQNAASHVYDDKSNEVTVAWHVRIVDGLPWAVNASTTTSPFLSNVWAQLETLFDGKRLRLFVFSEKPLPAGYEHFQGHNATFVHHLDVMDTFYHLVTSDVLVTSGSSFTAAAALYHDTGSLVLQSPPTTGIYYLAEHAILNSAGIILSPGLEKLSEKAQYIVEKKKGFQ